jgi:protein-disulfide isomerase
MKAKGDLTKVDKRFLSILAGLIIIFAGIFAITQHSSNKSNSGSGASSSKATNHTEGQNQKNVTLVEYGDYECPICEAYYTPLKEAVTPYLNDIHFQFRNLPLTSIHPNAFAAARAAEAAGMQNKYWEMHDMLYDQANWQVWSQSKSPISLFESYAQTLGLNLNQYKQDYSSSKVNDAINADVSEFNKTGKSMATPSFFLDGQYIDNSQMADNNGPSVNKISQVIKDEIAKKK